MRLFWIKFEQNKFEGANKWKQVEEIKRNLIKRRK